HTRCYRDWSSDVCSSDLGKSKLQSVFRWRQFRLQLRFSVVRELILTSITDDPNFRVTDFHSKLSWPSKQSDEKESQLHRYEPCKIGRASCREREKHHVMN